MKKKRKKKAPIIELPTGERIGVLAGTATLTSFDRTTATLMAIGALRGTTLRERRSRKRGYCASKDLNDEFKQDYAKLKSERQRVGPTSLYKATWNRLSADDTRRQHCTLWAARVWLEKKNKPPT